MKAAFALFGIGLAAVIISGLGLAWDGSYQLVYTLENQIPQVNYGRWTQLAFFSGTLWVSQITNSIAFIAGTFQVLHALLVIIAFVGAWRVVHERAPAIFVWAALGILIGTLPAQACLVCQAVSVAQLGWLVILAVLIGLPRWTQWLTLVLAPVVVFYHPLGVLVFAVACGIALFVAWRKADLRRHMLLWSAILFGVTVLAVARMFVFRSSYEAAHMALQVWLDSFQSGVFGLPLQALGLAWLAAVLIFLESYASRFMRIARLGAVSVLLGAFIVLALWASDPAQWARAVEFRNWAFFLSLPFFVLAVFDRAKGISKFRMFLVDLMAVGFAAVLVVQSVTWSGVIAKLSTSVASQSGCIEARNIPGIPHTALANWSVTAWSFLEQGQSLHAIAYYYESCATQEFHGGYFLSPFGIWDFYRWDQGWFDKHLLSASLGERALAR